MPSNKSNGDFEGTKEAAKSNCIIHKHKYSIYNINIRILYECDQAYYILEEAKVLRNLLYIIFIRI